MNMLVVYFVVGLAVAALASVVSDRFRSNAGGAAVVAGLLWPLVVVGLVQVGLWVAAVKVTRAFAPAGHPVREFAASR